MIYDKILEVNHVYASLVNMIIGLISYSPRLTTNNKLYAHRISDAGMFGDTKLFISNDIGKSYQFKAKGKDMPYNLLTQHPPVDPKESAIKINTYRQIPLTTENYLTKQAFMEEGSFAQFQGVLDSWMVKTRAYYQHTTYSSNILAEAKTKSKLYETIDLTPPSGVTGRDVFLWQGQELFRAIEDMATDTEEGSREWNDFGFMRSMKLEDTQIVCPTGILSNIRKHDIPFLFNQDAKEYITEVHWKYFVESVNTTNGTTSATNTTIRSLVERDYGVGENIKHVFAGDLLPNSTAYLKDETYVAKYTKKPTIQNGVDLFIINKEDIPILDGFSTGSSFWNAQTLTDNKYLTFGHSSILNQGHIGEFELLRLSLKID